MERGGVMLFLVGFYLLLFSSFVAADGIPLRSNFMHATYFVVVGLLYIGLTFLHFARSYFLNMTSAFSSKSVGDSWLLLYYVARDGLLLFTFVMSLILLQPYLYVTYHLAVPFFPISIALLGLVVFLRFVSKEADEWTQLWEGLGLLLGVMLYWGSVFLFALDGPVSSWWKMNYSSVVNPGVALFSLQTSWTVLGIVLVVFFFHFLRHLFTEEHVRKKHHTHSLMFKVVSSLFILIIFLLICLIVLSRVTGTTILG